MTGCLSTEPGQIDIYKNTTNILNSKSNNFQRQTKESRNYTSRPSCFSCKTIMIINIKVLVSSDEHF